MVNTELSNHLSTAYSKAYPFPHIIIDNFFSDTDFLRKAIDEIRNFDFWGFDNSDIVKMDGRQVNKFFTPWCQSNISDIASQAPKAFEIMQYLNSPELLKFLEKLTGIPDLEPDDLFSGGGIHKIKSGGKLAIHSDYLMHPDKKMYRRINLLLYLNEDWNSNWGGDLELWDKGMTHCVSQIEPIFNRAVIFNTTYNSNHGHPQELKTPTDRDRLSFAMYYFTKEDPGEEGTPLHDHAIWKKPINSIFKV